MIAVSLANCAACLAHRLPVGVAGRVAPGTPIRIARATQIAPDFVAQLMMLPCNVTHLAADFSAQPCPIVAIQAIEPVRRQPGGGGQHEGHQRRP